MSHWESVDLSGHGFYGPEKSVESTIRVFVGGIFMGGSFPPEPRVGRARRASYIFYIELALSLDLPYKEIAKRASDHFGVNITVHMVRQRASEIKARQRYEKSCSPN